MKYYTKGANIDYKSNYERLKYEYDNPYGFDCHNEIKIIDNDIYNVQKNITKIPHK